MTSSSLYWLAPIAALAPGFQYDNVFGVDPGRASVSTYVDIKSSKSHQISTRSF